MATRMIAAALCLCSLSGAASACDAAKARFALRKTYSEPLAEKAREKAGARIVRQMVRGRPYTMEYFWDRLNLHTNRRGRVLNVSCG